MRLITHNGSEIAPKRFVDRLGMRDTIARTKIETQHMPKTNVVAIRDKRGRYLKGMPGGPGRPLGSRKKMRDDFADMHTAWLERGPAAHRVDNN